MLNSAEQKLENNTDIKNDDNLSKSPVEDLNKNNIQHTRQHTHFDTSNSIIINFNDNDYSFKVYTVNKQLLGSFSSSHLVKFIASKIYTPFMENVNIESSVPLIQKYIGDIVQSETDYKIVLLNHLQSPFMGDIDMLIKLYQGILKSSDLTKLEIQKIPEYKDRQKVIKILKQLSYVLLNYCLRLIAQITDNIKNDESKTQLKNSLIKYSIMIVYKLNAFVRDEIDDKINSYKSLQDDLLRMGKIKIEMYKKLSRLEASVKNQSSQISTLNSKLTSLSVSKDITSMSNSTNNLSSTSDVLTFSANTNTNTTNNSEANNSSYMFRDSDCYFTESGNDFEPDYLSSNEKK